MNFIFFILFNNKKEKMMLIFLVIFLITLLILLTIALIIIFPKMKIIILRDLAINVITSLNKEKVDYWVDFGTLLGIIRDGDIIYHDFDVDVVIVESDDMNEKMQNVYKDLKSKNIRMKRMKWSAYRAYSYFFHCDMYINKKDDKDKMYIGATGQTSNISYDLIGTPKYISWKGIQVRVPEFPEKVLEYRYGSNWKTPIKGDKGINS